MGELLAKIPLSSGKNNLKGSTPLVKRECVCKPIFPPAEMPLPFSQTHFSTRRNAFVIFAKPFFHPSKCLCHFRKTIFPPAEMPLSISQNHFSTRRNAFVIFAKPFSASPIMTERQPNSEGRKAKNIRQGRSTL